jgi:hypothetical protein
MSGRFAWACWGRCSVGQGHGLACRRTNRAGWGSQRIMVSMEQTPSVITYQIHGKSETSFLQARAGTRSSHQERFEEFLAVDAQRFVEDRTN